MKKEIEFETKKIKETQNFNLYELKFKGLCYGTIAIDKEIKITGNIKIETYID